MPEAFLRLARDAAAAAGFADFTPDACLINRYRPAALELRAHLAEWLPPTANARWQQASDALVQAGVEPECRCAGDGVAGGDRGLHRRGAPPGRQQGEVQIDPAVRGHRQQLRPEQRTVGHHRTAIRRQRRNLGAELGGVGPRRAQ